MYKELNIEGKGLWIFDDGRFLIYRKGKILIYDNRLKVLRKCKLPIVGIKRVCRISRYLERIVHSEPRFAMGVSENEILLQLGNGIYNYNSDTNTINKESLNMGSRALSCCKITGVLNFEDSIVIGDYGGNDDNHAVNIYQRSLHSDDWKTVYSFKPGEIKHIHGFCCNKNCVYIMTGDMDNESGIWIAEDNFHSVRKMLAGSQQYRTCQMFCVDEKIYYCTDAPSEPNYLYCFEKGCLKQLQLIRGTCIYGVRTKKGFLFSTTCEPDVDNTRNIKRYLNRKPGAGIIGRNVDIMYINNQGNVSLIDTYQNDNLPLRLMQYGTVLFSNYCNGKVLCTPVAVRYKDFRCFLFEEEI